MFLYSLADLSRRISQSIFIRILVGEVRLDYISGAYWDVGERSHQEDSVFFEQKKFKNKRLIMAVLADGIGGLSEGETASGYIIEKMAEVLNNEITELFADGKSIFAHKKVILRRLYLISKELKEYALVKGIKLGSTMSLILITGRIYLIVHVGDSYILRIRKRVSALTPLHVNPDGSLNKCVGSFDYYEPFTKVGFVFKNTGFLLSSDGFIKKSLKDASILNPAEINREVSIERRLYELARKSKEEGERDNMSALYFKCF